MARTITREDMVYTSFPILKREEDKDGNLVVYGRATDGSVDSDRQIVDPQWSGPALERWLATKGNVRVQHSPHLYPAGKGISVEVDRDGDGAHWVKALIVEDTAKKLVKAGVLQDFSVGIAHPLIIRDRTGKAAGGIVTGNDDTEIAELSIVDRGSNRNSGFTLVKSRGLDVPWTYGDLAALLAQAEATVTKSAAPDDEPDDEPDDDTTGGGDPEAANKAAYQQAILTWRADEPKRGDAPLTGTEYLAKAAAWQKWDTHGHEWGLDGTDQGYQRWLGKRQFDPGTGGGVDRDKLPDSDFAGPHRSFPIVTPGDVSDAAHLVGHADNPDEVRARIVEIAHRKGPAFVAELPDAWKTSQKATTPANQTLLDLSGDADAVAEPDMVKAATCPRCGHSYDPAAHPRRCPNCGKKLPKANVMKGSTVDKGRRLLPPDVKPAGKHREPDGDAVEALERDAGMPTDPDPTHDKTPASVKTTKAKKRKGRKPAFPGAAPPFGAEDTGDTAGSPDDEPDGDDSIGKNTTPYAVKRMHDALCAAYDWDTVAAEYPALKGVGDAMLPTWFAQQVQAHAAKGDMARVAALAGSAQEAAALAKGLFDPAVVADGRAMVHKAFTDMYPTAHLTPSNPPTPGQFHRPYISAGHAPLNAGMNHTDPAIPPVSHTINPDMFDRPLITEGHEADSPSNKGDNLDTGGSVRTGSARTYYRNASKEAARAAMQAMHDHIAHTHPDLCPMAASKAVLPPNMGDTNRPHPVQPMVLPKAPGEKATTPTVTKATKSSDGLGKKALAKLVKSAVRDATRATAAQYKTQLAALRKEIDELGAMPDPAQAPLRGVVRKAATTDTNTPVVVEKVNLVDKARQEAAAHQAEYVGYLRKMAGSDNPAVREQAEAQLERLLATTT